MQGLSLTYCKIYREFIGNLSLKQAGFIMKRVLVAMSGGVDSSAAVSLLQAQGYDVAGATMKLFDGAEQNLPRGQHLPRGRCCTADDTADAKAVCRKAGVPHFVFNFKREFKAQVIDTFVSSYLCGETPNPCIDCNRYLKFDKFLRRADELDYDYIATGHYAVIERYCPDGGGGEGGGAVRYRLRKAADRTKDQSYVLYFLSQAQLARLLLPIGGLYKADVKAEVAARFGIDKRESQDICFVPDGDYAEFIRAAAPNAADIGGGDIVRDGRVIGRHNGAFAYTVGQRRGLGVSAEVPLYVCGKSADTVYVGEERELYHTRVFVRDVNIISPDLPVRSVRTRYNSAETPASVTCVGGDRYEVVFDTPVRAATAGQAAVFYCGDYVVGGGTVDCVG